MALALRTCLYAAIIWGGLFWVARQSTYFPGRAASSEVPPGAEVVTIATPDGERLRGWWLPAPGSALVTLYLHGNGGYLEVYAEHLQAIRQAGHAVLIIDYRGYGESTGSPSEAGLYVDAQAGYHWLRQRGYPPERIVVQGLSLGTAVAVEIGTRNRIGGLVLEAPFSSARAVAAGIVPVLGWTLPLGFDSIGKISALRAPLLVIHGDRDRVIPPRLGQDLYRAAPEPKEFLSIPGAGHEDLPFVGAERYQAALRRLYARCGR